jgi:galactonate dehydratase
VFQTYDVEWVDDLLKEPVRIENGEVVIPDGPGFGIELDDDVVEEHAYTEEKVHTINLFEKDWEKRAVGKR